MGSDAHIVVVGAGISGLLAARTLADAGKRVTIIEKGRGVGGRMATRRVGKAIFDHGAQFLSARTDRFTAHLGAWQAQGLITPWSRGFPDATGRLPAAGHVRYRGVPSMTSVPKSLAAGLDVRLQTRVARFALSGLQWSITLDPAEILRADALLITAPLPQTLDLLRTCPIPFPSPIMERLQAIGYNSCFALMVTLESAPTVPSSGGVYPGGEPIRWIGDNRRKGVSPDAWCLTIHAGADFTHRHFEASDADVTSRLLASAVPYLGATVVETALHRWRYSEPRTTYGVPSVLLYPEPPLLLAGDGFGGPNVEGAAESGLDAARVLLSLPHPS